MKTAVSISRPLAVSCLALATIATASFVKADAPAAPDSAVAVLAPAPETVFNLLAPAAVRVGETITVNLVALNPANYTIEYEAPVTLRGELAALAESAPSPAPAIPVTLRLYSRDDRGVEPIARGRFVSHTYTLALPAGVTGLRMLELREPALMRAVVEIKPAPAVADAAAAPPPPAAAPLDGMAPPPAITKVKRGFIDNFAGYEPIYFIYGADDPAAKFQFSFLYRILADEGYLAKKFPLLKGLSFAYTQRSLWDIDSDSSPFYDTSYMPELFCAYAPPAEKTKGGGFHWLGFQAGYAHESNGRDGDASRSMNKLTARASIAFGNLDGWRLILLPRVWGYIGDMSDNPDLNDYRGYMDLGLSFGKNDNVNLAVYLRGGQKHKKGAVQIDLTYPMDTVFKNFAGYFLIQYWNGYGESLLNYNKRTDTVRFGVSLVR